MAKRTLESVTENKIKKCELYWVPSNRILNISVREQSLPCFLVSVTSVTNHKGQEFQSNVSLSYDLVFLKNTPNDD